MLHGFTVLWLVMGVALDGVNGTGRAGATPGTDAVQATAAVPAAGEPNGPWPCRIGHPRRLTLVLQALWEGSPTFRRQCERIARERALVSIAIRPVMPVAGVRAFSQIGRITDGRLYASVQLLAGTDALEVIPHELEHVIEQLDGVDLHSMERGGKATSTRQGSTFETQRAIKAGRSSKQEVREAAKAWTPVLASRLRVDW